MQIFTEINYRQKGKDQFSQLFHSHTGGCEIIQVWSDEGRVLIKDQVYPMRKGMVFLINAIENHCTVPEDLKNYERNKVILKTAPFMELIGLAGLDEFAQAAFERGERVCFELDRNRIEQADRIFRQLEILWKSKDEYASARMVALLIELLLILCGDEHQYIPPENSKLAGAIQYIDQYLEEKLTIEDICRHVNISKYYLCHMFKKELNMTVMQYILERRLAVARRRLLDTGWSISEISICTGFSSFSYFSRVFREKHGCSPMEFRKNQRKKELEFKTI